MTQSDRSFQRKKLIEIRLIRFAVLLKITPLPRDSRAGVKDDCGLIHDMTRRVLHNHPYNAADELHRGGTNVEMPSDNEYTNDYFLTKSKMKWFWDAYTTDTARLRELLAFSRTAF